MGTFPVMRSLLVRPACLGLVVLSLGLATAACKEENTKLLVTGLEPDKGDSEGDTYVRIKGNRFTADGPRTAKIYFGGRPGRVVRFESDSEIVVQPPGGKPGEVVEVRIDFEPGGTKKIANGYSYFERNKTAPTVDDLDISKGKGSAKN